MEHRITSEILQKSIAAQFNVSVENVQISSFEVTDGSNKGDNFASSIKAVNGSATINKVQHQTFDYMAKCMPTDELSVSRLNDMRVMDKETVMYSKVIPSLNAIYGEEVIQAPKVYYSSIKNGVLIMENLKTKGFFITGKRVGLKMDQIKPALSQLSAIHAASFRFIEVTLGLDRFKADFECLNNVEYFSTENEERRTEELLDGFDLITKAVFREFIEDAGLLRKIEDFYPKRKRNLDPLFRPRGKFNCILHNDAWCNNMMFNDADEVKMLDFQLCRRARPTLDLAYFLGSSTTPAFRKERECEMLRFYFDALQRNLRRSGFDDPDSIYSYGDFNRDFDECRLFLFLVAQLHAILQLSNPLEDDPFENVDPNDAEGMKKAFQVYQREQIKAAKENIELRTRLIEVVTEAAEKNVL